MDKYLNREYRVALCEGICVKLSRDDFCNKDKIKILIDLFKEYKYVYYSLGSFSVFEVRSDQIELFFTVEQLKPIKTLTFENLELEAPVSEKITENFYSTFHCTNIKPLESPALELPDWIKSEKYGMYLCNYKYSDDEHDKLSLLPKESSPYFELSEIIPELSDKLSEGMEKYKMYVGE